MNIIKERGSYIIFNNIEIFTKLEKGNYSLDWDSKGNCFIKDEVDFKLPSKVYEVNMKFKDQALKSFKVIKENMGILLEGTKGTGKTLDSKEICIKSGLPIIMINKSIPNDIDFISYLNTIEQDYVLFIDEFEKLFPLNALDAGDRKIHNQDAFLTFMNGAITRNHKILFLLTSNDEIADKFVNRPSRVRFYKSYKYMPQELYDGIILDRLKNKVHEKDLRENIGIQDCTIDLLNVIIDEINIHDIPYSEFKEFFNHKPAKISYSRYKWLPKLKRYDYVDYVRLDKSIDMSHDGHYMLQLGGTIEILSCSLDEVIYKIKALDYEDDEEEIDLDKVVGRLKKKERVDIQYRLEKSKYSSGVQVF